MGEIMRDYTATGKYKSENIRGNQFMEEHEREFFDNNAIVLERQAALLAENYRSGQDDSLYDFIADLEEHAGEYVVDGALLTCTRCSKHARKVMCFLEITSIHLSLRMLMNLPMTLRKKHERRQ